MMITVPVQLSDEDVAKIDYLVQIGKYKNRTQAIKHYLKTGLLQEIILFEWEEVDPQTVAASKRVLDKMCRHPQLNFSIISAKSAHELIAEERERWTQSK
jgi:Arc/MetJ-type ribon-helix-helix transcriptional regulator